MAYRTKTYIAGDWTGDKDLIDKLYEWNNSKHWALHFVDAHELTQARDSSLYCSIKKSLAERLDASKTFVLIVGANTKNLTKGNCRYCGSYNSYTHACARYHTVDFRSYIEYECEKAVKDGLKIVVLYNYSTVNKDKCPVAVKNIGKHLPAYYWEDGKAYWDYQAIKKAIEE